MFNVGFKDGISEVMFGNSHFESQPGNRKRQWFLFVFLVFPECTSRQTTITYLYFIYTYLFYVIHLFYERGKKDYSIMKTHKQGKIKPIRRIIMYSLRCYKPKDERQCYEGERTSEHASRKK